MPRYFKDNGYGTLSGGKVLHHGFSGKLADDIDRPLGRRRSPTPQRPLQSSRPLKQNLGLGSVSCTRHGDG